jgi:hypothetical protein
VGVLMNVFIPTILKTRDRFDWQEYLARCSDSGVAPQTIGSWAQRTGLVLVAMKKYPELTPLEAYQAFMVEVSEAERQAMQEQQQVKPLDTVIAPRKTCCGGGKVL